MSESIHEDSFWDIMRSLEGKTIAHTAGNTKENENGDEYSDGVIITCTDGSMIEITIDYDDVDLVATRLGE